MTRVLTADRRNRTGTAAPSTSSRYWPDARRQAAELIAGSFLGVRILGGFRIVAVCALPTTLEAKHLFSRPAIIWAGFLGPVWYHSADPGPQCSQRHVATAGILSLARRPKPRGQLRIIGGKWRGRIVPVPAVSGLRPTPDRLRETLFNWLVRDIPGARCLDLFAGSGALSETDFGARTGVLPVAS